MATTVPQAPFLLSRFSAWLVLAASMLLTLFTAWHAKSHQDDMQREEFVFAADQVSLRVEERLKAYALLLRGAAGLLESEQLPGREEWRAYSEKLRIAETLPGVQGLGFAQWIPQEQLESHVADIRAEGFADYAVTPPGPRTDYSAIVYLEPFDDRNRRAFGYDMYSEPVRREAMARARDTGMATLSGKVELLQETGVEVQAGTLLYVPVYRHGSSPLTPAERREMLAGWAYSPFRMTDLMRGILSDWESLEGQAVGLSIYDESITPDTLLYSNHSVTPGPAAGQLVTVREVSLNVRPWQLQFIHLNPYSAMDYAMAWTVLAAGSLLSLLLFALLRTLSNTEAAALNRAEAMTRALQESELRWRFAIEGNGDGLWDWNLENDAVFFSPRWKSMLGFAEDEIEASLDEWARRVHPEDRERTMAEVRDYLEGRTPAYYSEHRVRCKDGTYKWILDRGMVITRDAQGKPLRMIGTHADITAAKEQQLQLEQVARHDQLTGLPNRMLLMDRLHQAMALASRRGERLAVVFIDLDGFKTVNDMHGHDAGDALLVAVARRMKQALREGDTLARLGGDEFVAVLVDIGAGSGEAEAVTRRLMAAACGQLQAGDATLQVSASAGLTFFPQEKEVDGSELLRQADLAMYKAKLAGKACYRFFDRQ